MTVWSWLPLMIAAPSGVKATDVTSRVVARHDPARSLGGQVVQPHLLCRSRRRGTCRRARRRATAFAPARSRSAGVRPRRHPRAATRTAPGRATAAAANRARGGSTNRSSRWRSSVPSGEKASVQTQSRWPASVRRSWPVAQSQSRTVLSPPPPASVALSGEKASAATRKGWSLSRSRSLPGRELPHQDLLVRPGRGEQLAVGRDRGRIRLPLGLPGERPQALAGLHVPEADQLVHVEARGRQRPPVRREDDPAVAGLADHPQQGAGPRIVKADAPLAGGGGDERPVGRDGHRVHRRRGRRLQHELVTGIRGRRRDGAAKRIKPSTSDG